MKTSDFYYDLPQELIAQDPLVDRSSSRLLIVHRKTGTWEHKHFTDVVDYLNPGDCLVINDTKVIPARLIGERIHKNDGPIKEPDVPGAKVEILLSDRRWETLVKPGKRCRQGDRVSFGDGRLTATIAEVLPDGNRLVDFNFEGVFEEILSELGQMPLPPYITHELKDKNRYQTVYARYEGSAAAPTAGLHFTEELLQKISDKGIDIAHVTLHVGLGTFRPVKEENILDHEMHTEWYQVRPEDAEKINNAKSSGHRVICVGTTSCRTVESVGTEDGLMSADTGETSIFIYPGYRFKVMDALITNFHLPESTLIMLVSAYAGRELVLKAYEEAVKERYRFFSFGDACLFVD